MKKLKFSELVHFLNDVRNPINYFKEFRIDDFPRYRLNLWLGEGTPIVRECYMPIISGVLMPGLNDLLNRNLEHQHHVLGIRLHKNEKTPMLFAPFNEQSLKYIEYSSAEHCLEIPLEKGLKLNIDALKQK